MATRKNGTQTAPVAVKVLELNIETVAIEEIDYDKSYQREEVPSHVKQIADHFTPDQYGIPMIGRRRSGRLYCVNGLQRIAAAKKDGYTHVQVHVFDSRGAQHEAKMFTIANRKTRKISGVLWHKANVTAREPDALWIESILTEYGLTALPEGEARHRVMATGILYRIWRDMDITEATRCLKWALDVMVPMWQDLHPARDWARLNIVAGLAYTARDYPQIEAETVRSILTLNHCQPKDLSEAVTDIGHGNSVLQYAVRLQDFVTARTAGEVFV